MHVPFSVSDFLDRAVQVYGDRTGVVDEPDQPAASLGDLTYAEMGALARRQAARLDERGIGVGDRVAVVSHNSARLLTSFYGVSGSGRVLVPVNFRLQPDEVRYIVEHSGARVLYVDPELDDALSGRRGRAPVRAGRRRRAVRRGGGRARAVGARRVGDGDHQLHVRHHGPAQGRPDHAPQHLDQRGDVRPARRRDRPRRLPAHAAAVPRERVGVPLRDDRGLGVPQVVLRKVDGAEILRRVEKHGVTVMCAAPAVAAAVLDAAQTWEGEIPGRDRVRIIMAGAPPPTKTVVRVEEELGWEFIQIYGLTETSPLLTVNRTRAEWDDLSAEERATRLTRAGAPAIGVTLKISEPSGEGDDEDPGGEVLARSNVVLEGYWEQPEESAAALRDGWFHTGDGGAIGDDGYLTISDRKKDVIITGGENVSSIEVEDVLFSHPAVAEVAVIGVPDEKWGETIKALVVLAEGEEVTEADLIAWCKEKAAGFKAPTSIEFRDELARTATGKLQKFKLRAQYWEGRDRQVN